MPDPKSSRSGPITAAPIEQPFETAINPFGTGALNLRDQHDAIPVGQFAKHTNLRYTADRSVTARSGLSAYATGGTAHRSLRRLHDPQAGVDTFYWGIDQSLYRGLSGALTSVDSGYSGDPITLLPHRPPLSGDPWMFVADRSRMRKARADGLVVPIGLPAPAAAPTVALATEDRTTIADFAIGAAEEAPHWTATAGYTYDNPPVVMDTPETLGHADGISDPNGVGGVHFGALSGTLRAKGYYDLWGIAISKDLSMVGTRPATDDDYIHLWINFSNTAHIEEFRLYFVCAGSFNPAIVPGLAGGGGANSDAYVKTFASDEFSKFVQVQQSNAGASEDARVQALRDQILRDGHNAFRRSFHQVQIDAILAQQDSSRNISQRSSAGSDIWKENAIVGVPLRRGDFKRIGEELTTRNWSTLTGIVCVIKTGAGSGTVAVRISDLYLTGGSGPDSGEPGSQPFDYRYTHYDPRTGAESNPSPEMSETLFIDSLRRGLVVGPVAYGDSAIRQRIYRRGGSLTDDWFFAGTTTGDGTPFTDRETDDGIVDAGSVNLDHYQPVATVDDAGATVLAQPVPILFGPANGILFGLGDPYRPGHLYWCIPDEPDHWPVENNFEVCPPSEELMAGLMYGAQPYCFSRERLYAIYPNLSDTTEVTVSTTACRRGLVGRWAWAIGLGGIYGVAKDGIFLTGGGAEVVISQDIEPLFRGETWNGYSPVDFAFPNTIRLSVHLDELLFLYQGIDGNRHVLAFSILYKGWTAYEFGPSVNALIPDEDTPIAALYVLGRTTGTTYLSDAAAFSDVGTAIACTIRSGDWDFGRPREDKLLGDMLLDLDGQGVEITLTNWLNNETVTNAAATLTAAAGRTRSTFDVFGTTPQRARTLTTEITWSSASARPILYYYGVSYIPEPDQTHKRVTQWDDLGHPDESYVMGITFDCDTGGAAITVVVERDFGGAVSTITTLSVLANGRHKLKFSWAALPAHKVRIRPSDDCAPWILYRADWLAQPEPPRIALWDIHFEAAGDQYYTGLDLFCDTGGAEKQIQITVDGAVLTNPYTAEAFWRITANGRRWIHLTTLAGRGHVFHFVALDANPGLLYSHKWYLDPEPSEQSNFNANYSIQGTLADKWVKGVLFEVDTFGATKTVTIELDGVVVDTLAVNTTGRKVVHLALNPQRLGRVLRVYPTDGNPARPYTVEPLFDVEPYALTYWRTQEGDDGIPGWKTYLSAYVTLVSTADVTMTVTIQRAQSANGAPDVRAYTIPSTAGLKREMFVPFFAVKGVKRTYEFQSTTGFRLYREESSVLVQPWGVEAPVVTHAFGNDALDPTRGMTSSALAAARSGGSL